VRNLQPKEVRAQALLVEVDRREQEHIKLRKEKDQTYQSALDAYQRGDLDSAANKLERFRDLDRRAPHATSPHQGAAYQKLYDEVRSRRDQLAAQEREARRQFDEQNFAEAASICEAVLAIYPNNVVFRALHDDIEQAQRLEVSAYVAKIERQVAAEPDLNSRVSILEEAQKKYPAEQRFEQSLQAVRTRRDTVDLIAGRARTFEEQRQFSDALGQWETLRNIHPKYPGLDIEIDRLNKRREQQSRADAKAHCVTQVDQALAVHNYVKAASLAADGLEEFAGDAELIALQKKVRNAQDRALQAEGKANEGKELTRTGQWKAALDIHREAFQLDAHNPMVRSGLIDALLKEAGRCIDSDWRAAEPLVQEALDLDPNNPLAKSICTLIQDKRQAEEVSEALSKARELQAQGDTKLAFAAVDAIRDRYPREPRLIHYRASLRESLSTKEREELRLRDLEEVNRLARASKETTDVQALESIFQKSHVFSKYGSDAEFREPLSAIQERLRTEQEALKPLALAAAVGGPDAGAETCRRDSAEAPGKQRVPERIAHARWRIVVRDLRPTFIWAGIGFALVALVLIMAVRPQSNHANLFGRTKEVPSKLVSLAIQGAERNEYQIFDTNGADITDGSVAGLSQGKYNLIASRSGFKKFELPFSIDPTKESSKSLVVQWQTLLPELRFSMSRSGGAVMVDDTARTLDAKGALTEQWSNGSHKILWTNADGDYAEVHFEVSDAEIIVPSPVFHGYVVGIAAVLKNGELTYQTVNSSGGVSTVVDGQSASRPSAGRFSVPSAQIVSFKVRPGEYPLGDYQVDPAGPPAIYVYIASQARPAKGSKPAPPIDIPKEIGPGEISGSPRTPVVPTEEEQRRQKEEAARRKLDEVKKLEEDKQKLRDALLGREKASKTVKQ
jgi:tetratricopeptide (TPR) repeat protein